MNIETNPDARRSAANQRQQFGIVNIERAADPQVMVVKTEADSYKPPKGVQAEAARALAWIREGYAGDGFTDVGRARARDLASGRAVSEDTVRRMASYFARHEVDKQGEGWSPGENGYPSAGRVAWAAWGGDPGRSWANGILQSVDAEKSLIVKQVNERRFTLGPWYVPNTLDAHGEWTDTTELQDALWDYVKKGNREIRLQHTPDTKAGEWVEALTWPFPVEVPMTSPESGAVTRKRFPAGTVFLGVQWEPWAWEMVKRGEIRGYSVGGVAERRAEDPMIYADVMEKHLPGKHDQRSHAGGKTSPRNIKLHPGPPLNDGQIALFRGGSAEAHLESDGAGGMRFTAERQALHDEIVMNACAGKPSQAEPRYVMMGGGPAAGKSSILGRDGVDVPSSDKSVHVDSDGIKGELPEYRAMTTSGDPAAAAFSHEESSYLAKRIQATAFANSQDVVLDGTGDSSADSVRGKINAARKAGYKVEANYVTIDTDEAVARANSRAARTGRVVPESVIRGTHASVSSVFPEVAGEFDSVTLFDNNGSSPKLIARGGKGALTVIDAAAYGSFLAKAG